MLVGVSGSSICCYSVNCKLNIDGRLLGWLLRIGVFVSFALPWFGFLAPHIFARDKQDATKASKTGDVLQSRNCSKGCCPRRKKVSSVADQLSDPSQCCDSVPASHVPARRGGNIKAVNATLFQEVADA